MTLVSNFECLFLFIFSADIQSDLKEVEFSQSYLFGVKAPLYYTTLKVPQNFKTQLRLKKITIPNIQNSTLTLLFYALSK